MSAQQLKQAILRTSSIDALFSLYSSHSAALTAAELSRILIGLRRLTSDTGTREKRSPEQRLAGPVRLSLSDSRFVALIDHVRLSVDIDSASCMSILLHLSRILFQAVECPPLAPLDGDPTTPITTRRKLVEGTLEQSVDRWPSLVWQLLEQLLSAVQRAQWQRQEDGPDAVVSLLQSIDALVRAGCFHPLYPSLLSSALHTLLQPSSQRWWETRTVPQLSTLAFNLIVVADVAESAAAAVTSVAERVVQNVLRLQRPWGPVSSSWASADSYQLEWLYLLPHHCKVDAQPLYWEQLCSAFLPAVQGSSFRCLTSIISALSRAGFYYEPLLLSAAARLAHLLLSGNGRFVQVAKVKVYSVNLLHSLASLCVSPQHPVMLTLFAAVLNALYTPKLTRHEAISAVWSVMVMRYYERRVVSDVVEVWRGCDATTDAVVMTGEEQREVGAKPSNEHTRLRVVEKRRVQVMKAVDRLVAHINSVDGEAGEASRSVRRRAFWELSQVEATWATHRRLQRSASHLYDEQGLPHFRADLLQQLSDEAADHSNDGRPDYPRQVTFAAALLEQLAALGCSPLDSASLPSQPHLLLRLLGVRVPYPTPGNPSATLPLLLEPLGSPHVTQRLRRGALRVQRRGSAEVQRRWLEGSGWPLLTVDPLMWSGLMELQNSDRPSMLERWVKEAVREWEERMAWEGWGDGSVVMDMELPRQARDLYIERHRPVHAPPHFPSARVAAA